MPNVRFRSESISLKTRNGALGVESRLTPIRRLKTAPAAWTKNHRRSSAAACKPGGSKIIFQYQVLPNLSLLPANVTCEVPFKRNGMTSFEGNMLPGNSVVLSCEKEYFSNGSTIATCLGNGTLDRVLGNCVKG